MERGGGGGLMNGFLASDTMAANDGPTRAGAGTDRLGCVRHSLPETSVAKTSKIWWCSLLTFPHAVWKVLVQNVMFSFFFNLQK